MSSYYHFIMGAELYQERIEIMSNFTLEEYKERVKKERNATFMQPYDLIYDSFVSLGYDKKDVDFFKNNASHIVEQLRKKSWDSFVPVEGDFTSRMLCLLIDEDVVNEMTPTEAISWYAKEFSEYIYALTLSNTQSRRSRAGKEFEAIIELILVGAGVPYDSQGNIGKKVFAEKGLGKLVDVVSPGVVQFMLNKRNTVLISAKTTLRERWQEVPEEMGRTGAREMFLATLDDSISKEVLDTLYEANIQVTTTRNIKDSCYPDNDRVLTFEELVEVCLDAKDKWSSYVYDTESLKQMRKMLEEQVEKHGNHDFVKDYYKGRLDTI